MRSRSSRLKNIGLYVITDFYLARSWDYKELVSKVCQAGAGALQLRDKQKEFEQLVVIGKELRQITKRYNTLFIVNDDPYLACEVEADGVHLGQEDMKVEEAREILGPGRIIGLSTHSQAQIVEAEKIKPDYIGIGPVFLTKSKESLHPPVGTRLISWAAQNSELPFVAIGGINENNFEEVLRAGATNVAVLSAVMAAADPGRVTERLAGVIKNFARRRKK